MMAQWYMVIREFEGSELTYVLAESGGEAEDRARSVPDEAWDVSRYNSEYEVAPAEDVHGNELPEGSPEAEEYLGKRFVEKYGRTA